jgi:hypothetical protein
MGLRGSRAQINRLCTRRDGAVRLEWTPWTSNQLLDAARNYITSPSAVTSITCKQGWDTWR